MLNSGAGAADAATVMDDFRARQGWRRALAMLALAGAAVSALSAATPGHAETVGAQPTVRVRVLAGLGWTIRDACADRALRRCAHGPPPWHISSRSDPRRTIVTLNQKRSASGGRPTLQCGEAIVLVLLGGATAGANSTSNAAPTIALVGVVLAANLLPGRRTADRASSFGTSTSG